MYPPASYPSQLTVVVPPYFMLIGAAPTETYTLSLHDALPISRSPRSSSPPSTLKEPGLSIGTPSDAQAVVFDLDRKSTRLNSSHSQTSYAVLCLKKKSTVRVPRFSSTAPPPSPRNRPLFDEVR